MIIGYISSVPFTLLIWLFDTAWKMTDLILVRKGFVIGRAWCFIRSLLLDKQLDICISESTLVAM